MMGGNIGELSKSTSIAVATLLMRDWCSTSVATINRRSAFWRKSFGFSWKLRTVLAISEFGSPLSAEGVVDVPDELQQRALHGYALLVGFVAGDIGGSLIRADSVEAAVTSGFFSISPEIAFPVRNTLNITSR
jgi:hypothetical protein